MNIEQEFPKGIIYSELFMGIISSVTSYTAKINFYDASSPSASHFSGGRYGKGEVGEFVLIEGQLNILLGRIIEVKLPESERQEINTTYASQKKLDVIGNIQLLGTIQMDNLKVQAGVENYPRLGDRVYAAPHRFISKIPSLMENSNDSNKPVMLNLGAIDKAHESNVLIKPEKLFGRHCAILGATGGGKSWTTARIIEECLEHNSKIILIDATSEYRGLSGKHVKHCHLGKPVQTAENSIQSSLPPNSFLESDFIALFEPSGKAQGPKFREAIKSLRLAKLKPKLATNGYILKINQDKTPYESALKEIGISDKLEDPKQEFDVFKLVSQIEQECVWPPNSGSSRWGNKEDGSFSHCLSLLTRINGILTSLAFQCVFHSNENPFPKLFDDFMENKDQKLLRICLSGISYEYKAREIIANVLGRNFLNKARKNKFNKRPVVVIVDEAHNFLGRNIGLEDSMTRLDAFEIIAKEGRKHGLNLCLTTQRPRDITEGVLSQMGALIVHRLTNDRDREVVERACGEIDKAASSFLPNLKQGEAVILGADFPIPLTIQINKPKEKPKSDGPDYQTCWKNNS
jgi:uncharacterized protein